MGNEGGKKKKSPSDQLLDSAMDMRFASKQLEKESMKV